MGGNAFQCCCGCEKNLYLLNPDIYTPDFQCLVKVEVVGERWTTETHTIFNYVDGVYTETTTEGPNTIETETLDFDNEYIDNEPAFGIFNYTTPSPYLKSSTTGPLGPLVVTSGTFEDGTSTRTRTTTSVYERYDSVRVERRLSARFDVSDFVDFDAVLPDGTPVLEAILAVTRTPYRPSEIVSRTKAGTTPAAATQAGKGFVFLEQDDHPIDVSEFDAAFTPNIANMASTISHDVKSNLPTSPTDTLVAMFFTDVENNGMLFTRLRLQMKINSAESVTQPSGGINIGGIQAAENWHSGLRRSVVNIGGDDVVQWETLKAVPFQDSRHIVDTMGPAGIAYDEAHSGGILEFVDPANDDVLLSVESTYIGDLIDNDYPEWLPLFVFRIENGHVDIRKGLLRQYFIEGDSDQPYYQELRGQYHIYEIRVNGLGIDKTYRCISAHKINLRTMVHVYDETLCVEPFADSNRLAYLLTLDNLLPTSGRYRESLKSFTDVFGNGNPLTADPTIQNISELASTWHAGYAFAGDYAPAGLLSLFAFVFPNSGLEQPYTGGAGYQSCILFDEDTERIWHHGIVEKIDDPASVPKNAKVRFWLENKFRRPRAYAYTGTAPFASIGVERLPYDPELNDTKSASTCPDAIVGSSLYEAEKRASWRANIAFGHYSDVEMQLIGYNVSAPYLGQSLVELLQGSGYANGVAYKFIDPETIDPAFTQATSGKLTVHYSNPGGIDDVVASEFQATDIGSDTALAYDLQIRVKESPGDDDSVIVEASLVVYYFLHYRDTYPDDPADPLFIHLTVPVNPSGVYVRDFDNTDFLNLLSTQSAKINWSTVVSRESIESGDDIELFGYDAENIDAIESAGAHGIRAITGIYSFIETPDEPGYLGVDVTFTSRDTLLRNIAVTITPEMLTIQ